MNAWRWREWLPGAAALAFLGAWAWSGTLADARMMGDAPGTMGMPLAPFVAMWALMMTAMMLPSLAPAAFLWVRGITLGNSAVLRLLRLSAFVAGYLVAWAASGAAAWALMRAAEGALAQRPGYAQPAAVAVFAVAGVYQFTPWKRACLGHCRSPVALVQQYASIRHPLRDLHAGAHHGLYCLGCCWGLMAVLASVGLMNLPAMLGFTALIFAEKLLPASWRIRELAGAAFLILAGAILLGDRT